MRRAYRPRHSTLELVRRIRALDGIERVDIIAPHHGVTVEPARIKVTLDTLDGEGKPIYTIFSMKEAREWLDTQILDDYGHEARSNEGV